MLEPSANEQVWNFLISGGIFMAFIAACSFLGIAVSIHRALTLKWSSVIPVGGPVENGTVMFLDKSLLLLPSL